MGRPPLNGIGNVDTGNNGGMNVSVSIDLDPLAVRQPCRDGVGGGVAGDASRRSAVGAHDKDVGEPKLLAVKRNLGAVRGKAWTSHWRSTEACVLDGILPIGVSGDAYRSTRLRRLRCLARVTH